MKLRSRYLLLSVGLATASIAAFALTRRSEQHVSHGPPEACVTARLTDYVPPEAPVIEASNGVLDELPAVRTAVRIAIDTNARAESIDVPVARNEAIDVLTAVRDWLPYYEGDGPAGVYVRSKGRVVVLNAIGIVPVEYET